MVIKPDFRYDGTSIHNGVTEAHNTTSYYQQGWIIVFFFQLHTSSIQYNRRADDVYAWRKHKKHKNILCFYLFNFHCDYITKIIYNIAKW